MRTDAFFYTYYEMWHQMSLSVLDILHLLTFLKICPMMNIIYHLANRIVHFFLFFITFCLKIRLKSDQFSQNIPESYTNNKWKQRVLSLPILLDRPGERSSYIFFCIKTICFIQLLRYIDYYLINLILISLLMALS